MPIAGALDYQSLRAAEFLNTFADVADAYEFEDQIGDSLVVRDPVGVVAAISPSNFPLLLTLVKVGPALAAGCTVVVKPPETAPGTIFHLAEVAHEVGLPPGVLNVITGYGPEAGEPLATHPLVDMISFTGSTGVGRRLLELGSQTVKRAHLELGGKSAALVLDDADLESSLRSIVGQAFTNAGQVCFAWSRIMVRARAGPERRDPPRDRRRVHHRRPARSSDDARANRHARRQPVRAYIEVRLRRRAVVTGGSTRRHRSRILRAADRHVGGQLGAHRAGGDLRARRQADRPRRRRARDPDRQRLDLRAARRRVLSRRRARPRRSRGGCARPGRLDGFKMGMHAPFGGFKQSGIGRELACRIDEYLEVKSIQLSPPRRGPRDAPPISVGASRRWKLSPWAPRPATRHREAADLRASSSMSTCAGSTGSCSTVRARDGRERQTVELRASHAERRRPPARKQPPATSSRAARTRGPLPSR